MQKNHRRELTIFSFFLPSSISTSKKSKPICFSLFFFPLLLISNYFYLIPLEKLFQPIITFSLRLFRLSPRGKQASSGYREARRLLEDYAAYTIQRCMHRCEPDKPRWLDLPLPTTRRIHPNPGMAGGRGATCFTLDPSLIDSRADHAFFSAENSFFPLLLYFSLGFRARVPLVFIPSLGKG